MVLEVGDKSCVSKRSVVGKRTSSLTCKILVSHLQTAASSFTTDQTTNTAGRLRGSWRRADMEPVSVSIHQRVAAFAEHQSAFF